MRCRLSFLMPSPAMAVAVAALLAAGTGLAVAASSSSPVIRACANKKTGVLRLANKCRKSERSVSWNQSGVQGPQGLTGATGAPGATGAQGNEGQRGPQGPGATSFTATLAEGSPATTIARLENGLVVEARCGTAGNIELLLATADTSTKFQGSGTVDKGGALLPVDVNGGTAGAGANASGQADFDLVARDTAFAKLAHVIAGGTAGSTCSFWGMVTPSS